MFAAVGKHLKPRVWYVYFLLSCFALHSALPIRIQVAKLPRAYWPFQTFLPCNNVDMHNIWKRYFTNKACAVVCNSNNIHRTSGSKTIPIIGYVVSAWHKCVYQKARMNGWDLLWLYLCNKGVLHFKKDIEDNATHLPVKKDVFIN